MVQSGLYDEDVLLWSEQQAAILRALGRERRDLPNELDIENVAEEIEGVGLSELHSVQSRVRLILAHLIKMALEPNSDAVRHWEEDILNWHAELGLRFTPSMRRRVDMDSLWRKAWPQAMKGISEGRERDLVAPESSPLSLDAFLIETLDLDDLASAVSRLINSATGPGTS